MLIVVSSPLQVRDAAAQARDAKLLAAHKLRVRDLLIREALTAGHTERELAAAAELSPAAVNKISQKK